MHKEICELRRHDLPVTKSLVKSMVLSRLTEEDVAERFPKGVSNRVYYTFLVQLRHEHGADKAARV